MNRSPQAARTSVPARHSLSRKLMTMLMAAVVSALTLSATALLGYEVRAYRKGIVADLRSQADLIAASVAPALAFDDPKVAHEALAALRLRQHVRAAAIYRADGALFARYGATPAEAAGLPPSAVAGPPAFDDARLQLTEPVLSGSEVLGTVLLVARQDTAGRVLDYLWILGLSTLGGVGLAALIFRRMQPAVTRPILAVADASRRIMEERDYSIRVTASSNDEVGILVRAFNRMLDELSVEMRERRAAEEALRGADRRKDEFLATLAHELRNPLAPLANGLAILARAEGNVALQRKAQQMMERQLAHIVRLIDDLLEVSRITRGKVELRRQTADLVAIARMAAESVEHSIRREGHTFAVELPDSPVWVDADEARLTQVLVNLLINACRYTDPGGHIRLRLVTAGNEARIEVADNGIGIAPEHQQRIFEMFEQVDKSPERGTAGLGLGLTIAQQLVALHGGTLRVDSAGLGHGSTFAFVLSTVPAPAAAAAAAVQPDGPTPARGDRRASGAASDGGQENRLQILIADDNVDFGESLAGLLAGQGHRVRLFTDGREALQAALQSPPDLALLDIGMPGLNGYELASRLRALPETAQLLLVAITGWGQAGDRLRVREAGFDEHWIKPIDVGAALAWVDTVAAQRSLRPDERGSPSAAAGHGPSPAADDRPPA